MFLQHLFYLLNNLFVFVQKVYLLGTTDKIYLESQQLFLILRFFYYAKLADTADFSFLAYWGRLYHGIICSISDGLSLQPILNIYTRVRSYMFGSYAHIFAFSSGLASMYGQFSAVPLYYIDWIN